MKSLRIRIDRIVDFGTAVSLIGIDTDTNEPVTIHVDHRPFAVFWQAWWEAGLPQPVEYDADRLVLHLNLLPADDADEVLLVERDQGAGQLPASSSGLDR
jgi:hypothetical protein